MSLSDSNPFRTLKGSEWNYSVYFVLARDTSIVGSPAYLKIGYSNFPHRRLIALQTGCPLTIIKASYVVIGDKTEAKLVESALHSEFAELRAVGEWYGAFKFSDHSVKDAVLSKIEHVLNGGVKSWVLKNIDIQKTIAHKLAARMAA